ncbi:MAG TPA: NAD(P)-binding protein [Isosphaeraceae bacterium]
MDTATAPRQKIAILGGGVGAMTAAFALTESPGWKDKYEITVYQLGWRLGGKGASGRDAANGQRILEHGLHIWFGFYHNAFGMMQKTYEECLDLGLSPGSPFSSWTDAFRGQNLLTAMEWVDDEWKRWDMDFIIRPGEPGQGEATLGPWDYVKLMLGWMKDKVDQEHHPIQQFFNAVGDGIHLVAEEVRTLITTAGSWFESTEVHVEASFPQVGNRPAPDLHAANALAQRMHEDPAEQSPEHREALLELVRSFHGRLHDHWEKSSEADRCRREWILFDMATAAVRGLIADDVLDKGFDAIDIYDGREWLRNHGCHEESCNSSMVRGMYDLVFAYEQGDIKRANFAAGTAVRATLRILFDYKGSITYKMQAGMGDTIFSPLYLMLKNRGVKFEYFHKVTNLGLSADKTAIDTIAIDVQAKPKGEYNPIVTVKGLPCWPSTPLYDQLENGAELQRELEAAHTDLESGWCRHVAEKKVLQRGRDFDLVILGISLGAIKFVGPELVAASPAWRDLAENVKTVETQAFQLWMSKDAAELGWESRERAVVGAYVEPIDTWADMTQVLDNEDWPAGDDVKNVSYLCAVIPCAAEPPLDDAGYPRRQEDQVKANAIDFLKNNASVLWPRVADPANPPGLDWSVLVAPDTARGETRFDYQFWRANTDPTERYVLSLKGTTRYRFKPDDSGFENLYLAGDWTHNDINLGCVEAAAMSALMATRAICGYPQVIFGEDEFGGELYAHP